MVARTLAAFQRRMDATLAERPSFLPNQTYVQRLPIRGARGAERGENAPGTRATSYPANRLSPRRAACPDPLASVDCGSSD
jgi:hypothetical protein